jgi:hypothetical protein
VQDNFTVSGSEPFNTNIFNVRVDHYFSDKFHSFGRYSFGQYKPGTDRPPLARVAVRSCFRGEDYLTYGIRA